MEFNDERGLLGQRTKYLMIVAVTMLPVIAILFAVFLGFFLPAFRGMQRVVDMGYYQIRPLQRLQVSLIRSVMPPNDFIIHGDETEWRLWLQFKHEVDSRFSDIISQVGGRDKRLLLTSLRADWLKAAPKGEQLFNTQTDSGTGSGTTGDIEGFDAAVYEISAQIGVMIDKMEVSSYQDYLLVERRIVQGVLYSVAALLLGVPIGFACSLWLTRARERIIQLTMIDELTGVYSRRGLERAMASIGKRRRNGGSIVYAMLVIDIDRFKLINDRYGHDIGDHALRSLASVTGEMIRRRDIFGRFGGEEFLVFLPETTIEEADALAERIRRGIESTVVTFHEKETSLRMTVSIGYSCGRLGIDPTAGVFKAADTALYQAKRNGRNRVAYTPFEPTKYR